MREVAARGDAGLVVMHMRGTPKTMQEAPAYDDVVHEVEQEMMRMVTRLTTEGVEPRAPSVLTSASALARTSFITLRSCRPRRILPSLVSPSWLP